MCVPGLDPITLLSLAASGGGAVLNRKMANDAAGETTRQNQIAMDRERAAREAELARQQALEQQQSDLAMRALTDASPASLTQKPADPSASAADEILAMAADYNAPKLQGQLGSGVVADQIGRIIAGRGERQRGVLTAAGNLAGQDGQLRGMQDILTRMAGDITNIGSERAGSARVAQLETSIPAATVHQSSSPLGDILMLGGMLGAGIGGKKAGLAGKSRPIDLTSGLTKPIEWV